MINLWKLLFEQFKMCFNTNLMQQFNNFLNKILNNKQKNNILKKTTKKLASSSFRRNFNFWKWIDSFSRIFESKNFLIKYSLLKFF